MFYGILRIEIAHSPACLTTFPEYLRLCLECTFHGNFKDVSHSFELSTSPPSYAFRSPFLYFPEAATGVVL